MLSNIKLIVAYEGTAYLGWQETKAGPSIETTLKNVLEQILQEKISLQAASRTDAGVHAEGQVVNFFTSKSDLSLDRLCISLNSLLPKDIVIRYTERMHDDFHPTLDCQEKEYHYWICANSYQLPQHRNYSWHIHHPLNLTAMRQASQLLIGCHDFSSFTNTKKNEVYVDYVREVKAIEIIDHPQHRLQMIIRGNHFLYKMVRNIVGTLVYIGMGKLEIEEIPRILKTGDRSLAGMTAPAHGLTLFKIYYNKKDFFCNG